jgi:hypothetical protein
LKRRKAIKPRRERERRSGRVRDTAYMDFVRGLPCCSPMHPLIGHASRIHAHHAGQRAAGRRANDDTCIPLCGWCHDCWHGAGGPFNGWDREQRRTWADARIAETQALYARRTEACPF